MGLMFPFQLATEPAIAPTNYFNMRTSAFADDGIKDYLLLPTRAARFCRQKPNPWVRHQQKLHSHALLSKLLVILMLLMDLGQT